MLSFYKFSFESMVGTFPVYYILTGKPNQIIANKGYQNCHSQYTFSPIKGSFYTLLPEDLLHNEKLCRIRIIVEKFFGRSKC